MEQEQEHVFVNAFLFLFPKCSLSVHEHGKERRTLTTSAVGNYHLREKVGFIEKTAWRQRRSGGREVTVTSRLHRQKDKERQRKTEENVDRRPVAPGADDVYDDDDVYYYIS